ncbi:hypothetical protein EVAR_83439_1 [Eumeta japonica]|uniref:Uncharacterized protein n=1 Tax=Eumeta variegata TaxID=151549 RepID=A0A4C1TZU4_EUMVA|nr:hypothetical protein EVAR_83439_1 [Eumeta japonica]
MNALQRLCCVGPVTDNRVLYCPRMVGPRVSCTSLKHYSGMSSPREHRAVVTSDAFLAHGSERHDATRRRRRRLLSRDRCKQTLESRAACADRWPKRQYLSAPVSYPNAVVPWAALGILVTR